MMVWTRTPTVPQHRRVSREVDLLEERPVRQKGRDRDVDGDQEERPRDEANHQPHREIAGAPFPKSGGGARKITEKTML